MCSIAGFCNLPYHWKENINKMNTAQYSRGPDEEGIWTEDDRKVVFGHRRLSIIDLSTNGNQPMISENGRFVICFNGEIYNYKQICNLLTPHNGSRENFQSDTRVLLEAVSEWGIDSTLRCVKGMFAFGLYDREERKLYLARDRMGEKPLYYGTLGNGFIFASTLNAIKVHDDFRREIDISALSIYFRGGYIPCPYSIYKNIYKLEAGSLLQYDIRSGDITLEKYWNIDEIAKSRSVFSGSYGQARDELHQILINAVKEQTIADVPVGVLLSSGVDSSAITSIMAAHSVNKVRTFSIGFKSDSIQNEAPYAKRIAEHLGTEHTELYLGEKDVTDAVPKMAGIYGEPYADASQIPTYLVSKLARTRVKVALTGDAGDELFCGYPYYPKYEKVWKTISRIPKWARYNIGKIYSIIADSFGNARQELYGELMQANSIEDIFRRYYVRGNYAAEIVNYGNEQIRGVLDNYPSGNLKSGIESLMLLDQMLFMTDDILAKVDRAAMAVSLETRVPFLDRDIISFSWSLPIDYKYKDGVSKRIIRDILYEYIPKELVDLPKRGFSLPLEKWLKEGVLRKWAENLLSENNLKRYEYLNNRVITRIWKQFMEKGYWNPKIWYILMYLEWEKQESEIFGC